MKERLEITHAKLTHSRRTACEEIMYDFVSDLTKLSPYYSFGYFCPKCNEEYLEDLRNKRYVFGVKESNLQLNHSAEMKYLPSKDSWKCLLCGETGKIPVPVPKMLSESFLPAYDLLMEEHRVERLEKYNDINDQKRKYHNECEKEIAQKDENQTRDINKLKLKIRESQAAVGGSVALINSYLSQLSRFELIHRDRIGDIQNFTKDVTAEIDRSTRVPSSLLAFISASSSLVRFKVGLSIGTE